MELVSVVVCRDDVEEQDVLGLGVQPRQPELHLREHLPETRGELQGGWVHWGSRGGQVTTKTSLGTVQALRYVTHI